MVKDAVAKKVVVEKGLSELLKTYSGLFTEVQSKFRYEVQAQEGSMDGLEDFYALFMRLKKDLMSVNNALVCIKRTGDISKFDISEQPEKELDKIFKDKK